MYIKLIRDRDTGKSKGYGFLKYADQRSTVLAVDNLNGATVLGRPIRVDHTRFELKHEDKEDFDQVAREVIAASKAYGGVGGGVVPARSKRPEGSGKTDKPADPQNPGDDDDDDDDELAKAALDPMAGYLNN